jgi:branched-chain amino acid aminotransferase
MHYVLAGIFATENQFDTVLLFNEQGNIAETFNANIFIISGDEILTPALTEYCLDGVMRQYVLDKLRNLGYSIKETVLTESDLEYADEIFISNATRGIAWIESYKNKNYSFSQTYKIHADLFGI